MTILEVWWMKTPWLTWQVLNHHLLHAAGSAAVVFLATMFGAPLEAATLVVMAGGLVAEIVGLAKKERLISCISDVAQYWMFTPSVLFHAGHWQIAVLGQAVLIVGYLWSTIQNAKDPTNED